MRPTAVLFACNFNRVRSPMAEAVARRLYGDAIFVDSCGLRPEPGVDPLAAQVIAEIGADLSGHMAKGVDQLDEGAFDLVVCFTPEAQARALERVRGQAVEVEYWPIFDPTLSDGSREAMLDAYRQVRDALRSRMLERFGPPEDR